MYNKISKNPKQSKSLEVSPCSLKVPIGLLLEGLGGITVFVSTQGENIEQQHCSVGCDLYKERVVEKTGENIQQSGVLYEHAIFLIILLFMEYIEIIQCKNMCIDMFTYIFYIYTFNVDIIVRGG